MQHLEPNPSLDATFYEAVEQALYGWRESDLGYRSENTAQQLTTECDGHLVSLRHRHGSTSVRLKAYGYGDRMQTPVAAHPVVKGNRLECHRGSLQEWYINRHTGVEQGFTLMERPEPGRAGEPLAIVLEVSDGLRPRLDEQVIVLESAQGQVLRYAGLYAVDAQGREIASRMQVRGREMVLEIDDADAAYPLVVDPTFTQQVELLAGTASDTFGGPVAVSGTTVVVGANSGSATIGAAYVFTYTGTTWVQQARLTASDGATGDSFGGSVAIDGATLVVGAWNCDVGSNQNQGAAYVFTFDGTEWTQQAKLTASDGKAGDWFGYAVGVSGNTAVIGASRCTIGSNQVQGAAYVFAYGTTWSQQAKLTASDGAGGDYFGTAVAIERNTLVVGAHLAKLGSVDQGAAYVFTRSGSTWTQQAWLTEPNGAARDYFGARVALSGTTVVVTALYDTVGSNAKQGSAHVYVPSGSSWAWQATLTASDGAANDLFGSSVAISGAAIVVGAPNHQVGTNVQQGAVYQFAWDGTSWTQQAMLTATDGGNRENFGRAVAISGCLVVGSSRVTTTTQGAAYVFTAGIQQSVLTASDGQQLDAFGCSVAVSGTLAVVGAKNRNCGVGAAYVFSYNGSAWTQQALLTASDGKCWDNFGYAVAISGTTIAIGAPGETHLPSPGKGAVYVYVQNDASWTQQAKLTLPNPAHGDMLGSVLALSGSTLVAPRPGFQGHRGTVHVFTRTGSSWSQQADIPAPDDLPGGCFGAAVAISGSTMAIGSPYFRNGTGVVYVFGFDGSAWTKQATLSDPGGAAGDNFGISVGLSGTSLVVGSWMKTIGTHQSQGAVFFFTFVNSSWSQLTMFPGPGNGMTFGFRVCIDGGLAAVGSRNATGVNVYTQRVGNWSLQAALAPAAGVNFSLAVAASGNKVLVGATNQADRFHTGEGAVCAFELSGV